MEHRLYYVKYSLGSLLSRSVSFYFRLKDDDDDDMIW